MDAIRNAAFITIGRACGFTGLAAVCVMFGLSFKPPIAASAGSIICLTLWLILQVCALRAPGKPYRRTELWTILPEEHRPPPAIAQQVVGQVLKDTLLTFAQHALKFAAILLAVAVLFKLFGFDELPGAYPRQIRTVAPIEPATRLVAPVLSPAARLEQVERLQRNTYP